MDTAKPPIERAKMAELSRSEPFGDLSEQLMPGRPATQRVLMTTTPI